jgi:hypothetical protein
MCFKGRFYARCLDLKYQGGNWYHRSSKELCELFEEEEVVKFIKLSRLRWAGHVKRLNDND